MPGGDLSQYIRTKYVRAFALLAILPRLQRMHGMKRLHRDLESANVLLSRGGESVELCEFGMRAELFDERTKCRTFCGMPSWVAPQVIRGGTYGYKSNSWV